MLSQLYGFPLRGSSLVARSLIRPARNNRREWVSEANEQFQYSWAFPLSFLAKLVYYNYTGAYIRPIKISPSPLYWLGFHCLCYMDSFFFPSFRRHFCFDVILNFYQLLLFQQWKQQLIIEKIPRPPWITVRAIRSKWYKLFLPSHDLTHPWFFFLTETCKIFPQNHVWNQKKETKVYLDWMDNREIPQRSANFSLTTDLLCCQKTYREYNSSRFHRIHRMVQKKVAIHSGIEMVLVLTRISFFSHTVVLQKKQRFYSCSQP